MFRGVNNRPSDRTSLYRVASARSIDSRSSTDMCQELAVGERELPQQNSRHALVKRHPADGGRPCSSTCAMTTLNANAGTSAQIAIGATRHALVRTARCLVKASSSRTISPMSLPVRAEEVLEEARSPQRKRVAGHGARECRFDLPSERVLRNGDEQLLIRGD